MGDISLTTVVITNSVLLLSTIIAGFFSRAAQKAKNRAADEARAAALASSANAASRAKDLQLSIATLKEAGNDKTREQGMVLEFQKDILERQRESERLISALHKDADVKAAEIDKLREARHEIAGQLQVILATHTIELHEMEERHKAEIAVLSATHKRDMVTALAKWEVEMEKRDKEIGDLREELRQLKEEKG